MVPTADRDLYGSTLGRYVVRERIGQGGFGTVYRAEQPQLGRDVVIKVLHQKLQDNPDELKRFLREAQLASRLDHPFAAHVYAFGVEDEDGLAWLAMELVAGVTLKRWLELHGPMPLEQFVPFFERIAEVVQAAHKRGIVVLVLPRSSGGIDAVAFLPDGRVAAADAQRRLRVYDRGGAVLADLEIPVRVMSLRIDGTRLVAVPIYIGNAAPPLLVDVERYRVVAQLEGHVGRVVSARWVAGHQILTAGSDGTARLWDGSTGQLRQIYQGGSGALADATLAPDGLVMAGGADGLLRFWDAASGRLLWALQAHKSPLIGVHVEGRDIVTRGFGGELSRWTLPRSEQVIEACGGQERCAIMHP